ncbi:UDP-2,3-diacylglucosamine diphosphatase [Neotabrizicola shimadae]|uniref:UDP-2,3-diacylglucosamine diphosphatase n=1 Tax=Neotabrizicola shimadae TaxID=2807096 RepID=A0A8G0ZXC2_9RHOB|nr:UDP-2,3-diacylglucosamine diphosphatase [Neotabrizicola shimadae]QYZ69774.1 UDP-2,3-diacylglucosamine diphosphatase [Neotabrizicola shimadae]
MTQHPADDTTSLPNIRYHHRTLFLSDLHLGAHGCRADRLLDFLRQNSADRLYLVGDILDVWHPLRPRWSALHDSIIDLIRERMAQGMELVLLAGNHDAALKETVSPFAGAVALDTAVHRTARGRSFLVLHGDACDARILRHHLATRIGTRLDGSLRGIDAALRRLRRNLPADHRSLIERLLSAVNACLAWGAAHERRLIALAQAQGHDGVICGHFHKPALHDRDGLTYVNCGDWVDSLTAIAEDVEGHLRLVSVPAFAPLPAPQEGLNELEPVL